MGRLIDTSELAKHIALQKKRFGNLLEVPICNVFADMIRDTPTAKAIPKADYEARLKADVVAMLTEIQLEIEELDSRAGYDGNGMPTFSTDYIRKKKVNEFIQQKINALKEQNNEANS